MTFTEIGIKGAYTVALEKRCDERGFFARTWCEKEFAAHHLLPRFAQSNVSWNKRAGTLRGLHYQAAPDEETKLIRCVRGRIYYVVLDVRERSDTFGVWLGLELNPYDAAMLYVPGGCAVGYQTLEDDAEATYQVSKFYTPDSERGLRYDDPKFAINWPLPVTTISDKDKNWPDFKK